MTKPKILELPVLPLRGLTLFPGMVLHFDVGRAKSVRALEKALMADQKIYLVAQVRDEVEDPELKDLQPVGVIATVRQVMNLPVVESQVILMKYYQEMTLDEIGDCLNISRSTVKRYLRAGKKHLQQMIFE